MNRTVVTTEKSTQKPNVTMVNVDDYFSGTVVRNECYPNRSVRGGAYVLRWEAWTGVLRKDRRFLGAFETRKAAVEAVAHSVGACTSSTC